MPIFLLILFTAGIAATAWNTARPVRLKRLAKRMGGAYCLRRTELITAPNAEKTELFSNYLCRFKHIITKKESVAFTRLADMTAQNENAEILPPVTVFTAELTKGSWPALKIAALNGPFAQSSLTAVKTKDAAFNAAYSVFLSAPQAAHLLTPALLGQLARRPNVYLEICDHALIYHESILIPVDKLEDFYLRAAVLLAQLSAPVQTAASAHRSAEPVWTEETPDEKLQAVLNAAREKIRPFAVTQNGGLNVWKMIILLFVLLVLPTAAYFICRYLPR